MLELIETSPPVLAGRYELYGPIDTSGATLHYLAWDRDGDRWCSVAVLSVRSASDALSRQRFMREIQVLQGLKHPHIIRLFDAAPEGSEIFWSVTEVAEGGTVLDWLGENGPMPAVLAIDVLVQVCGALSAAHQAGHSHGHLTGQVVLVDRHSSCKLTGIRGHSDRGEILGDIRAAGVLLFQLLSGREWVDARAEQQLVGLPGSLAKIIEQATRKGRGGYAGVLAFSRDLEAAVLELPMPVGDIQPLAGPTAALPDDPALVWDERTTFPELERLLGMASSDDAWVSSGPAETAVQTPEIFEPVTSNSDSTAPSGGSISGSSNPIPYQMKRSNEGSFDETAYTSGGAPLYLDEEAAPADPSWGEESWSQEEEDEAREESAAQLLADRREAASDVWLVRLVVVSLLVLVMAVVSTVVVGTSRVDEAHMLWEDAASKLVEAVRQDSGIIYQLSNSGADRTQLENAYSAFDAAPSNSGRIRAAAVFAQLVEVEARARGLDAVSKAGTMDETATRVDQLQRARQRYEDRMSVHRQVASSFPGNIGVFLGLSTGPFQSDAEEGR